MSGCCEPSPSYAELERTMKRLENALEHADARFRELQVNYEAALNIVDECKQAPSYDWMPEARQYAAQCWCDRETSSTPMDCVLAEAIARRIALWMQTAAQSERNAAYYRSLVEQCGRFLGNAVYVRDDGTRSDDVLCAKVPELVEHVAEQVTLRESDLREWTETFAPYGCEPQACLHTFEELIAQAQGQSKSAPKAESPQERDAQREVADRIRKYRIVTLTEAIGDLLKEIRGAV